MSRTLGFVLCLASVVPLSGCAAQQRRDVGTMMVLVGAMTALVGVGIASECTSAPDNSDPAYPYFEDPKRESTCDEELDSGNLAVGGPMIFIGFGTTVLGSGLYISGVE